MALDIYICHLWAIDPSTWDLSFGIGCKCRHAAEAIFLCLLHFAFQFWFCRWLPGNCSYKMFPLAQEVWIDQIGSDSSQRLPTIEYYKHV